MKSKISLISALLIFSAPAFALDIDITNHPDKDFILGYKHNYPGCDVVWWASRWGTEHIMGVGDCDRISEEKVMSDLRRSMEHVKATTNHANFSEYLRDKERNATFDLRRGFCIFRSTVNYVFTTLELPEHQGWYVINTSHTPVYGLWKIDPNGDVITRTSLNSLHPETKKLDLTQIQDCQTLRRYEPALHGKRD